MIEEVDIVGPHRGQPVHSAGRTLTEATAAMLLLHGRGATAASILELAQPLQHPKLVYLAPEATNHTWYPHSFLAPLEQNEPNLASALQFVAAVVERVKAAGIDSKQLLIGGFSQGACLAAEFAARNAQRFGGLLIFSGGLIGPPGTDRSYAGDFAETPVFLGCSNVDPHIPVERVEETATVLTQMGAVVDKQIYPNMGHTIIEDELTRARQLIEEALGVA